MMTEAEQTEQLRQFFKYFNRFMVWMWRAGLGKLINFWPEGMGRIMVITHTGRKSGLKRYAPVNYAPVEGDLYCTAGFGEGTDWYQNILKTPEVEVWLPEGWWAGVAEDISDSEDRRDLLRQVLIASGFAASVFGGIDLVNTSDAEFDAATADYRLIRIRRTEPRTGPGGPGEYAWIWPAAVVGLLVMFLFRPRRRR
jgi:deazaflavin-dependent oxidoreductase (nitroreductase family)